LEFEDDAFVLAARAHAETGALVDLLTERHGRYAAHIAGGAFCSRNSASVSTSPGAPPRAPSTT
jgi:recombinational DNA repair protein (RecF pathway)